MSTVHDVIIIGSGPAGYTAAIYAARANLKPVVFEGSFEGGGALMNTTEVENYPGFAEGIMGPDLMDQMRRQAERFGATLITDDATAVDLTGQIKVVKDSDDVEHHAKSVILAMGSGYRKLGLPDEERLSGRGVSWCATCDGAFFRDKPIAVIGGGDSAVEEATFLSRFGSKVVIVHRRDELRASQIMQQRARNNPKIEFLLSHRVVAVEGANGVEQVRVEDLKAKSERVIPAAGLFFAIGHVPNTRFLDGQVQCDEQGYIVTVPGTTHTSVDGVFAAGDVQDKKYRQAITAAGSGCASALEAEHFLAAQH